ncbi:hypothetical protein QS257_15905 [Terrilactibacillus sp. S3-3]|nr:hypothetical protein QS257_15905 [Terrilactibacillus sp. S3-3]
MITKGRYAVSYGTLELDKVTLESGVILKNVTVAYDVPAIWTLLLS